jgi:hypothetical protein
MKYYIVIQQFINTWEDVEEIETNSTYSKFVEPDESFKNIKYLMGEYRMNGYPTRTINRRTKN